MTAPEAEKAIARINVAATDFTEALIDFAQREGWKALGFPSLRHCLAERLKIGTHSVHQILEAAQTYGLYVMCSASILQSRLTQGLPQLLAQVFNLTTDAQCAIQFVRSTPGVGSALIGMKQVRHVEENLAVAKVPPAPLEQFMRLFERSS